MMKTILLSLLIATSQAQTYLFSEGNDILTICPRIMTSFSVPSFRLEPTSSAPEFLNGSYEYRAESLPAGIQFNPEYERCDNSDGMMCSKLSLLYRDGQSVGRDSITVTYTASNGAVRVIRINYGFVGIYLEEQSEVVGRVLGSPTALNDSVLAFGNIPQPLLLCYANGTQEPQADILVVPIREDTCSSNIAPNGLNAQPGRFKMTIPVDVSGQHRVYIAARNCTSPTRSSIFDVIFDAPTTTEGPTTTQPPGSTTIQSTGLPLGDVIGIAMSCVVVALLMVTGVLLSVLFIWDRKRRKKANHHNRNGLLPGVERHVHDRESSPDLQGNHNERVRLVDDEPETPPQPPPPALYKELFIVLSVVHEKVHQLKQKLYGCFSNLHPAVLPNENGTFEQDLTRIVNGQHNVVIILGDVGEIHNIMDQSSSGRKWVSSLDSPAFRSEQLQNVFYVRFGTDTVITGYMEKLQHIPVREHPNDNDFDPAYVAKFIHERISEMMMSNSRNQLNQHNHLDANSSHSITPQLPPQNRLSTSDLGSELSDNSWKGASNEHKTGDEETHDTDGQVTNINDTQGYPSPLVNPAVARVKASSHASSTSGDLESASATSIEVETTDKSNKSTTAQNDPLKSSSTASIVRLDALMEKVDKLEKKVDKGIGRVEAVGDAVATVRKDVKTVGEDVKTVGEDIKGAVETVGEDVKTVGEDVKTVGEDVKTVGEDVKGAVETVGENFKDKAEMEDRMKGMEQDIEHAAGMAELARKEAENQKIKTIQPYGDDNDNEGRGTGNAATREDAA